MVRKYVVVNDAGRRIGESHPRAKLKDSEVDLIRDLVESLVEEGKTPTEAYRIAAEKFEITHGHACNVVTCRRRAQIPARAKRVKESV